MSRGNVQASFLLFLFSFRGMDQMLSIAIAERSGFEELEDHNQDR
jgi:hypothetical protein